jgi:hypothetical protein
MHADMQNRGVIVPTSLGRERTGFVVMIVETGERFVQALEFQPPDVSVDGGEITLEY